MIRLKKNSRVHFKRIAWNGSNEIGRKELGRPFWSNNLGRIDWGRIGSNGLGSKSICCLPWTWHFSRSTQVHSTQFRNGEDSTHGTGGRFDLFLSTHFRSPTLNVCSQTWKYFWCYFWAHNYCCVDLNTHKPIWWSQKGPLWACWTVADPAFEDVKRSVNGEICQEVDEMSSYSQPTWNRSAAAFVIFPPVSPVRIPNTRSISKCG